jgi:molybdate transport system substrate-binding protein
MTRRVFAILLLVLPLALSEARAEVARVAVASNFILPAQEIARAFEAATAHRVSLSFGSTGTLYAQIAQGAPHQVFLAADTVRPERAVAEGLAEADGLFVYAVGRLALLVPGAPD